MNEILRTERRERRQRRWAIGALVLVLAVYLGLLGRTKLLQSESRAAVEQAVLRSVGQCYAVEGVYPPELGYLEEHYGLTINHERYIVTYEAFSSNLPPDVRVLVRGGGK